VSSIRLRCARVGRAPTLQSLLALLALAPAWPALPATAANLQITVNDSQRVALQGHTFAVAKMTPDGALYLYSSDPPMVLRKAPSQPITPIFPSSLPTAMPGQSFLDDFEVDSRGQLYIPVIWNDPLRTFHSAVFVLDSSGRYQRTVEFAPAAEARHIAIDPDGNWFVLGVDARYYRGLTRDTSVLHKYTSLGAVSKAFSPQTIPMGGADEPNMQAKADINRGLLFIHGGLLYSVLTESRMMRVFDLAGNLVKQVTFSPPGSTDRIWHFVPLPNDTYLIHWVHSEVAGSTVTNTPYLSVHDGSGQALTAPVEAPWSRSFPLSSDGSGNCYFLHQLDGDTVELISTAVRLK
jgi:hypothetical protein